MVFTGLVAEPGAVLLTAEVEVMVSDRVRLAGLKVSSKEAMVEQMI